MSVRSSPQSVRTAPSTVAASLTPGGHQQKRPKYRQPTTTPLGADATGEWSAASPPAHPTTTSPNGRFQPVHPSALTLRSKPLSGTPARVKRSPIGESSTWASDAEEAATTGAESSAPEDEPTIAHHMRHQLAQAAAPTPSPSRVRTTTKTTPTATHHAAAATSRSATWSLQAELEEADGSEEMSPPQPDDVGSLPTPSPLASSPTDGSDDVQVLLQPIDTSRQQLEAEIARLQALLAQSPAAAAAASVHQEQKQQAEPRRRKAAPAPSTPNSLLYADVAAGATAPASVEPSAPPAASSASPPRIHKPSRRGMYMRPPTPDPLDPNSWIIAPTATLLSARERVRQRETTMRAYLTATARWWVVTLLKVSLEQLAAIRGSGAARLFLALPHVRDLLAFTFTTSTRILDYTLHTRLFRWVPFSSLVLSILDDPTLQAAWAALPDLPMETVQPWLQGPMRPLFQRIHRMVPFAGWVFPFPNPQQQKHLVAGEEAARLLDEDAPKQANGTSTLNTSPASSAPSPSPVASSPSPASAAGGAAPPSFHTSLISDLLTRIESQAALVAFLQADRRALQQSMEELRESQQRVLDEMEQARERQKRERAPVDQTGLRRRGQPATPLPAIKPALTRSQPLECVDIPSSTPTDGSDDAAMAINASSSHARHFSAPVTSSLVSASPSSSISSSTRITFVAAAAEARLQELYLENLELRGLAGAQESSMHSQELVIQAMSEEAEILADRIFELEAMQKQQQFTPGPGEQ